jgi:hypothetical protein
LFLSVIIVALTGRASSIVDSHDAAIPSSTASLVLSNWYALLSPVLRWLDTITLLSVPQTIWLFVVFALIVLGILTRKRRRVGKKLFPSLSYYLAAVLAFVASVEGAVVALPRPAAKLVAGSSDVVIVDFHSHTNASKDANGRFDAQDNRDWHSAGGFNVAYITDHVRFAGAFEAMKKNPARAGDSLVILSGVEGRYHRIFSTILLGLTQKDSAAIDSKGHLLARAAELGIDPVSIVAIPNRNLDSIFPDSLPHFSAIELVDAAPRGLGQLDREEQRIRDVAAKLNLILVSASNNHGWGHTVAGWNLMTIPGWRAMPPEALAKAIEVPFRARDLDAITIVKRLRPRTRGGLLPLTLPVAAYQIIASLTLIERIVWILWIWAIALLAIFTKRKSTPAPG